MEDKNLIKFLIEKTDGDKLLLEESDIINPFIFSNEIINSNLTLNINYYLVNNPNITSDSIFSKIVFNSDGSIYIHHNGIISDSNLPDEWVNSSTLITNLDYFKFYKFKISSLLIENTIQSDLIINSSYIGYTDF